MTEDPAVATVSGDDPSALMAAGHEALEKGATDEAIATFKRATELRPEGSEEHHLLGRAYLAKLQTASMFKKLGLSKKVRASHIKAIELDPDNVQARTSLAGFYLNAPVIAGGSTEKGMEQIEDIRKRDAGAAHLLLAGMYAGNKEIDKARREYHAAIALDPNKPDLYYSLGMMLQGAKECNEAFETFEAGVRMTGDLASLYQIGRTGVFSGENLERAREALERYIVRAPADSRRLPSAASARWRLGMVYERLQRKDLARREYEKALELEPDNEQAKGALENLG